MAKKKCEHDFIFLDKWQDADNTYWEFACRWCLAIEIQCQPHRDFTKDLKKRRGL